MGGLEGPHGHVGGVAVEACVGTAGREPGRAEAALEVTDGVARGAGLQREGVPRNSDSSSSSCPLPFAPISRLLRLPVVEDEQRRDAHHVEPPGEVRVLVDVQLGDLQLAGVLGGDLREDGGDHLARTAPLGPEVDDHRHVRRADRLVEVGGGEGDDAVSHAKGPFECAAMLVRVGQPP